MIVVFCALACLCGYLSAIMDSTILTSLTKTFHLGVSKPRISTEINTQRTSPNTQGWTVTRGEKLSSSPQLEESPSSEVDRKLVAELPPTTMLKPRKRRVIVAMTGATGAILGIRMLEKLRKMDVETHLIVSKWADSTIAYETDYKPHDVRALATKAYSSHDVAAPISSGSFKVDAMIVVPCSMKTLSSIATGYGSDLISRAADVTFKERRRLILVARETPLSGIHLENMMKVTQNGAIIFPPVPAFYNKPKTINDVVDQTVGRVLDLIDIDTGDFERWDGMHREK